MARQEDYHSSREGLLRTEKTQQLRPSLEDAYRSSIDSNERLDSLDLNANDKSRDSRWEKWSWIPSQPPWSSGFTYKDSQNRGETTPKRKKGLGRWLLPRKTCMIVILILALGLMAVVGSGALWVYKVAPVDGVRDPMFYFYRVAKYL